MRKVVEDNYWINNANVIHSDKNKVEPNAPGHLQDFARR